MAAETTQIGILTLPTSKVRVEYLQFGDRVLGASKPLDHCLVLIPGNPGLIGFYERFLRRIQEARPTIGVLGVGFTGHASRDVNDGRKFTLDDQLAHRLELLDHLATLHPGVRFSLAGHSIGAWLCLETLRLAGDRHRIGPVFLLFPTLRDLGKQAGAYRIAVAPGVRHVVAALAGLVSLAPERFKRQLVARLGPAASDCPGTIEKLLQRPVVANILHLGATEFRQVRELNAATIARHLDKLVFYYGAVDAWVPAEHHADIRARFPAHPHVTVDAQGCGHAFCLEDSDVVADVLLGHLKTA